MGSHWMAITMPVWQAAIFQQPWAIAPFLDGWAISDAQNNAIRLIRSEKVETINGKAAQQQASKTGIAFNHPTGLTADEQGNL